MPAKKEAKKDMEDPKNQKCQIHGTEFMEIPKELADAPDDVEGTTFYGCQSCIAKKQESFMKEPDYKPGIIERHIDTLVRSKNVPRFIGIASFEFLIGSALKNCYFRDNKGRVLSNEHYRHVAGSGHDKTTIFKWMEDEIIPQAFKDIYDYYIVESGTVKGFSKFLERDFKKHGERRIPLFFMKDEDNANYMDNHGNVYNDVFQGYSRMYNGELPSNTTMTHDHIKKKKVFVPGWSAGTPSSLDMESRERWEQGYGFRQIILLDTEPIGKHEITDSDLPDIDEMNKDIIQTLREMTRIRKARMTEDFKDLLNKYHFEVNDKKNSVEANGEQDKFTLPWIEVEVQTKLPEHLIKLSMVYAANRKNIDNDGFLVLDIEDIEIAKRQFDFYVAMNVKFFKLWLEKRSTKDISDNIQRITQFIKERKEGYDIKFYKPDVQNEDGYWVAEKSNTGEWARHYEILKRSKLPSQGGFMSFETVISTMIDREELIKREAKVYFTDGNKKRNSVIADFYRLKENPI